MWKGSAQRTAWWQRGATTVAIHSAASAETWVTWAQRSSPSRSKNDERVAEVAEDIYDIHLEIVDELGHLG
jgi:hypothetical protein